MMSLSNSLWLLKKKSKRLPEPTGGSPEVVHLLKYAFKLFGALMRVLESVPSRNNFFTLMLSGALRSGLKFQVRKAFTSKPWKKNQRTNVPKKCNFDFGGQYLMFKITCWGKYDQFWKLHVLSFPKQVNYKITTQHHWEKLTSPRSKVQPQIPKKGNWPSSYRPPDHPIRTQAC